MAQVGITHRISVPGFGTAHPIPTVWEPGSLTAAIPDGASASDMDTATIPGITRGGVPWATTDAVGIPTTDGARGVERPSRMCMESGVTRHIRAREQHGQIPIPAITAVPPAAPITTRRQVEHGCGTRLQHQRLHGQHLRLSGRGNL